MGGDNMEMRAELGGRPGAAAPSPDDIDEYSEARIALLDEADIAATGVQSTFAEVPVDLVEEGK